MHTLRSRELVKPAPDVVAFSPELAQEQLAPRSEDADVVLELNLPSRWAIARARLRRKTAAAGDTLKAGEDMAPNRGQYMLRSYKRVLAISAHPDDAELGCGGTILRAVKGGSQVHACLMSKCEDEAPKGSRNRRLDEFLQAAKVLGVERTHVFDFPNRDLPSHSVEMLDSFAELQETVQPDLVLVPWTEDSHQDHAAVALAAIRSFRSRESVLQYEILRYGSHSFTPNLFVDIAPFLEIKLKVLACFKSQAERRAYFDEESFRGLARTRGAQVGYDYAEGFLTYKMLW